MRYEVTEIEGFLDIGSQVAGISCMVVDTLGNRPVVSIFRTEEIGSSVAPWARRMQIRNLAADLCADLNDNEPSNG